VGPKFARRVAGTLAVSLLLPAAATASLRGQLHAALGGFDGRGTAALAVDLETGKAVYAHNASSALLPASNEKLAVTYAALVALGPSFRMRTEVLGDGRLRDGVAWVGDLVLKGFGDPFLDDAGLAALARDLRASGIRRVTGRLLADESYFDSRRGGPGWKPWFVTGESRPLSALGPDGAAATTKAFRRALRRAGVRVQGDTKLVRAGGWPLAVRFSPPLDEILRRMDVESDNYLAEMVLKNLGAVVARQGTTGAGASVVRAILAERKIPLAGVRIADGSGLSSLDRLTPKALVTILQRIWADCDLRPAILRILPVAGRDGTLRDRMRRAPARGNVRAKTGTLDNASALSGFVRDRYAFSILVNAPWLSFYAARAAQDRFSTVLAGASR
jgi:D-alanyl-D-alanine carboxypeptidase/D-alanyl-D-alanine-endopeptidase (penicillin-binding protein 4)